jgi:hypothetical protein
MGCIWCVVGEFVRWRRVETTIRRGAHRKLCIASFDFGAGGGCSRACANSTVEPEGVEEVAAHTYLLAATYVAFGIEFPDLALL